MKSSVVVTRRCQRDCLVAWCIPKNKAELDDWAVKFRKGNPHPLSS